MFTTIPLRNCEHNMKHMSSSTYYLNEEFKFINNP